ncbi:MAG: DegV family protein [Eubacteriales bacterium]|nr:DegV family protein [Eubacteriales bacterium]
MKTAVMTDSNSGITKEEADSLGIFLLPMPVIIDGETYFEGVNLEQEMFYESLTGGREVSTSQPSPGSLMDFWKEILSKGYEEIVHIPMSSGLSSSCGTALTLAEDFDGKVEVVDNHRISVTMRIAVMEAAHMAKEGKSALEIKKNLEERAYHSSIYITVDTLEFLKKGGRVTAAAAALGTVFHIKPVLSIQGGKLDAFAKTRGLKKAKGTVVAALQKDLSERFPGVDARYVRVGAAGSGLTAQEAKEWRELLQAAFPGVDVYYDPLSFSISCHTGPGAYGAGFSVVQDRDV